ncbi:MAG: N-acetylmuramoyl-L-alanine amidase [Nitrospiraceae bacterium]|nr:MAG: N-acetylmuramoyl-L-alanine amidase [Nitrospiraceae bacterium]
MTDIRNALKKGFIAAVVFSVALLLSCPPLSSASTRAERSRFQASIVDHRPRLNRRYKKVRRKKTDFIIVHTSELGLDTTLRVVSRGKQLRRGRSTAGGHTHYVIARDGRTFRILDRQYVADHAGRSMWNGKRDISKVSIGIELTGYHYAPITEKQYRSAGILIEILQGIYGLDDRAVLTHSQVAYGRPNRWFRENHRGRKRCAKNFVRSRAGLGPTWPYDPDVRARRLSPDPQLARVFYSGKEMPSASDELNIISASNSAWSIAGEDYNSPTTVYKLPDGSVYTGNQIDEKVGWNRLPSNTVVFLNQGNDLDQVKTVSPIKTISESLTAWAIAGKAYNATSTIYFLPSGSIRSGTMIYDWDDLPAGTRLIIGYRGPYRIYEDLSAVQAVGPEYNGQHTIYFLPSHELLAGDSISDFQELPEGTLIFVPST